MWPSSSPGRSASRIPRSSLHDALPISSPSTGDLRQREHSAQESSIQSTLSSVSVRVVWAASLSSLLRLFGPPVSALNRSDRKSTRLNSSHANTSYAVFCLKKKKSEQRT